MSPNDGVAYASSYLSPCCGLLAAKAVLALLHIGTKVPELGDFGRFSTWGRKLLWLLAGVWIRFPGGQ